MARYAPNRIFSACNRQSRGKAAGCSRVRHGNLMSAPWSKGRLAKKLGCDGSVCGTDWRPHSFGKLPFRCGISVNPRSSREQAAMSCRTSHIEHRRLGRSPCRDDAATATRRRSEGCAVDFLFPSSGRGRPDGRVSPKTRLSAFYGLFSLVLL